MREIRQAEFTQKMIENEFGIYLLCPRFGKCKTTLDYLSKKDYQNVLIVYPRTTIKKSWQDDVIKWKYKGKLQYSTTMGLKKLNKSYDVVILDEVHLYSIAQLEEVRRLLKLTPKCIALTGTLSNKSENEILSLTGLKVISRFSIEQAIKEGIVTDYKITVVMTELDNSTPYIPYSKFNTRKQTELNRYNYLSSMIETVKQNGGNLGLLPIFRMNIFKNSLSKKVLTKKLINKFYSERLLIFCGVTAIANELGVSVYHSKAADKQLKDDFCNGKFNHLAVCKMMDAGVTVLPINKCIINSFDSNSENLTQQINRLTNFEYDNPDKVAEVYIVCTNTEAELKWIKSALEMLSPEKITYKKYEEL